MNAFDCYMKKPTIASRRVHGTIAPQSYKAKEDISRRRWASLAEAVADYDRALDAAARQRRGPSATAPDAAMADLGRLDEPRWRAPTAPSSLMPADGAGATFNRADVLLRIGRLGRSPARLRHRPSRSPRRCPAAHRQRAVPRA